MIIAPHPDDETLGCGGWIYAASQNGAVIRIVFLTDGDAFRLAAVTAERRLPSHAACRALGTRRRGEAVAAAATLGVPSSSLHFLGYPDRGLTALRKHWEEIRPFHSPYTGRSLTSSSRFREPRPLCGSSLVEMLMREIHSFRPQILISPSPHDDHPDHRAAAWFSARAIESVCPQLRPKIVRCYLIHFGDWPKPMRFSPGSYLAVPNALARRGGNWESLPLDCHVLAIKARALGCHRSQHIWAGDLFAAFLRPNELLASWPRHAVSRSWCLRIFKN
jgi:LmbE family N-acetylglucosaminyl deacetylase